MTDQEHRTERVYTRILVVEDDPILGKLIAKTLTREGYNAHHALNGNGGLAYLKDNSDVLILLDYILPEMRAEVFISKMLESNLSQPFIIMTGFGDEKTAVELMKLGARDYIIKDNAFLDVLMPVLSRVQMHLYTEKKLAEARFELERSEQKHRMITENISDIVSVNNLKGKFTFVSPSCYGILGYKPEELIEKSPMDFAHPDDFKKYSFKFSSPNELFGEGMKIEFRFKNKMGEYVWLESLMKPMLDAHNQLTEFYVISRDITQRKKADELKQEELNEQHLLSEYASKMIAARTLEEIYQLAGNTINEICGKQTVMVSSYNPENKSLRIA
ncbi:MAG: PAS domain S-box protein, partial [Bacteroidota bacterium]